MKTAARSTRSDKAKQRDHQIVTRFIEVYCKANHGSDGQDLCQECSDLLAYAGKRLEQCPYDPKPKCKDCRTHCYRPDYRQKMKEVMRFSGMHFAKRGRVDWMIKYFR